MKISKRYVCLFLLPIAAFAQSNTPVSDLLPVKRVVLYKTGVGYFEHLGRVRESQNVTIPFTSGQLNDVLKSLTVLDLNGGRITGVEYGSAAPMDRQLGDLRLPVGEKASLTEFLGALRGARLEVRSGSSIITGRLLSVERKTRIAGGTTLEVDYLSLITDSGELRTTELTPAFSVKLLDRGLPAKMDRFLDVVSAGREADVRRMVISTSGTGDRSLFVSYVSEVPVWKTTYRIVLGAKAKPLLQGWAIVDNTVGEDWDKVELSLVAGAPHSFIQNLSQPYYSRRPVVPVPEEVLVSPQTYEPTLIPSFGALSGIVTDPTGAVIPNAGVKAYSVDGALLGQTQTNANGEYGFESLPEGPLNLEFSSLGFNKAIVNGVNFSTSKPLQQNATLQVGSQSETVTVEASALPLQTESSGLSNRGRNLGSGGSLGSGNRSKPQQFANLQRPPSVTVAAARAQAESAAQAQERGDLFEYKLKEPITIRKNRSALVPIVQSTVAAEKVSVWNEQSGLPRPQRALWLTNSSGLTLDGGSFSVMEDETFAGEGIFDPIRPDEKRLVSYATDLALNASSRTNTERERVARVRISHGTMVQESEIREKKTYTFRNEDTTARTVIVEHPVRAGYELCSDVQPAETTAAWKRFRVPVEPKQTTSLIVEEARREQTNYAITNVDSDQVALFVREKSINKTVQDALEKIVAQKAVVADLDSKTSDLDDEQMQIFDDQQRLRENMKSLKGSAEEKKLLERYTQQLDAQETRLDALRKESQQLDARKQAAQTTLDKMIEDLSLDVKL
ncbi:MAG TPA: carboxypeptidase regulatory-like domain-containing protein [Bryobacteraceae bacterium]|nr:carboxypeptidase regulatory-like domain-containing protein [Bryobacteraceae bacterium]